jgi:hypothetical protein
MVSYANDTISPFHVALARLYSALIVIDNNNTLGLAIHRIYRELHT